MSPLFRDELENGLRVAIAPLGHLHTATVSVFVKAGSRYEDSSTNGLAHFLEHMLFRGTRTYPTAFEFNSAVEDLGGMLYAATHVDFTMYELQVPPEHIGEAIALVGQIFESPAFHDIEVEKGVLREEILESLDARGRTVDVDSVARKLMFGHDPLAFEIAGTVANVERFGVDDLRAYMKRFYGAKNMVVSIAGAVEPAAMNEQVRRSFGSLPPGQRTPLPRRGARRRSARYAHVSHPGSQTDVRLSYPTFGLADPRQPALHVLSRIIDDGMSTRLHRRIVDESGLAYDVFASLETYEETGVIDVGAAAEHGKVVPLAREMLAIANDVRTHGVSERELDRARRRHRWDLRAMLDDDEAVASFYGTNTLFGIEETMDAQAKLADRVMPADIHAVANAVFAPAAARLSTVGVVPRDVQRELRALLAEQVAPERKRTIEITPSKRVA